MTTIKVNYTISEAAHKEIILATENPDLKFLNIFLAGKVHRLVAWTFRDSRQKQALFPAERESYTPQKTHVLSCLVIEVWPEYLLHCCCFPGFLYLIKKTSSLTGTGSSPG